MSRYLTLALACALFGCASQSFQPTFQTPSRPAPEQIAQEIAAMKPRNDAHVIVALTTDPQKLVAWDLSALGKGALWERDVVARSAPLIAGNAVVTHEGDAIVVRDLATGNVRVTLGEGARLIGADGEGDAVVIALAHEVEADDRWADKGTIAYIEGTRVRWTEDLHLAVGTPALVRGYVLVPWATQRLSVLDARDGAELARWHFNDSVLGLARVERSGVYVGQLGWMPLRGNLLDIKADAASMIAPLARPIPGQPPLLADGYAPVPEPDNAYHHVRVDFRVGDGDKIQGDALYARFYRVIFGMAASEDKLRFVHVLPRDVVGAEVVSDGLLLTDEGGTLRFLRSDGQEQVIAELGKPLMVSAIRAASWAAPAAAAAPAAPAPAPPSLEAQLYAAATLDDARLSAARVYAVEHLAQTPSAEVTAQLVLVCIEAATPEAVRRMACDRLEGRSAGNDAVLAALRSPDASATHTSALAKAAASMQIKAAAPLLLPRLLDTRTDPKELAAVISALAELGHQPAAPAIDRFLRLHHAEPEGSEAAPALVAATVALGTLRSKPYRDTLAFVSGDALTPEPLRKAAQDALIALDAPLKAASEPAAVAAAPAPAPAPVVDQRPRSLSAELVSAALKPVQAKLSACVRAVPDAPKFGRIAMVIARGKVEKVYVTPEAAQACVEPLVRAQSYPDTQQGRQNVAHIIRMPNATAKATKAAKPAKPASKR